MKRNKSYLLLVFTLLSLIALSQNETKIWYFGSHAGLDFSTNPPNVLTNSAINANEGCASISDAAGNLLFYSNGPTVWDKTHNVMANGTGLYGDMSTSQAVLIVKQPGNSNIYFVFTNDAQNNFNYGLFYSVVDMNLSAGNGSVTIKNTPLFASTTEKLCGTKHANGTDVWVLTHDWNSNNFRAYLVSATGVNTQAVISSVGTVHSGTLSGTDNKTGGYMKTSSNGKKIGLAIQGISASFELYDFNTLTGLVSNPIVLGNNFSQAYGCEFSADATKFYGGGWSDGTIWQWNLCAGSSASIVASQLVIATSSLAGIGSLQLALNGKIYVDRINQQTLGVINNPDIAGTACNYIELGQSVGPNGCGYGLPNFISNYFWSGPTLTVNTSGNFSMCAGETKILSVLGADTYTWNSTTVSPTLAISPNTTSSYTVVGTNTVTGCHFDAAITISVNACTEINELKKTDLVKIYPNPLKDILNIELDTEEGNVEAAIFNTLGTLLFSENITSHAKQINVDFLPKGLYYLKLNKRETMTIFKIIKE